MLVTSAVFKVISRKNTKKDTKTQNKKPSQTLGALEVGYKIVVRLNLHVQISLRKILKFQRTC